MPVANTISQTNEKYAVGALWLATAYVSVYIWSGVVFPFRGFYSSGWVLVFLLLLLCLSLIIFLVCYSFSAEWFNATVMTAITMMQNIETFWEKKNCTHLRLGDWSSGGEMKLFYKKESMKSNSWLTSCYFMTHFQCPWAPYLPFFVFNRSDDTNK